MSGFFGVASTADCVADLYYGTDYHSHLGTRRGGMVTTCDGAFKRTIHDISHAPFRTKFEEELPKHHGSLGLGIISDYEDQPLVIGSHHGVYALATVGRVNNLDALVKRALSVRGTHLSEFKGNEFNATEVVATLINQQETIVEGIRWAQEQIQGSCSMLLLTRDAIYAARDRLGRTPVIIGRKKGACAVTLESSALPNLGYDSLRDLGPGEIVRLTPDGIEQLAPPGRPDAGLRVPVDLLRLPRLDLRGGQHRGRAQPLRRGAGPPRPGRGGRGGGHPRLRDRPRHRLLDAVGRAVPAPVREVHADLAAQLHAGRSSGSATWSPA